MKKVGMWIRVSTDEQARAEGKLAFHQVEKNSKDFVLDRAKTFKEAIEILDFSQKRRLLEDFLKKIVIKKKTAEFCFFYLPDFTMQPDNDPQGSDNHKDRKQKKLGKACGSQRTHRGSFWPAHSPEFRITIPRPKRYKKSYPHNPQTFGEHLRKARMDRGLTAKQLADILDVSEDTILNWEVRNVKPRKGIMEGIEDVIN